MPTVTVNDYSFAVDGYLKSNLDFLKELPENDFDVVGLCTGYEGSGKTTLFQQIALYLDKDFAMHKIVFNTEQFNEAVNTLPNGSCILYDEADDAAVGANWMQEKVKLVVSLMKRIRKKNMFILFVTPTFFDMGKYFAIHRSLFLIHVYTNGLERGYFRFYTRKEKRLLYIKGKKEWNMQAAKPAFRGYFRAHKKDFPIDSKEYEVKKDAASAIILSKAEQTKVVLAEYKQAVLKRLDSLGKFTRKDLGFILGVNTDYVSHMRRETEKRGILLNNPQEEAAK